MDSFYRAWQCRVERKKSSTVPGVSVRGPLESKLARVSANHHHHYHQHHPSTLTGIQFDLLSLFFNTSRTSLVFPFDRFLLPEPRERHELVCWVASVLLLPVQALFITSPLDLRVR
jgi:hypothetical protein